MSTQTTIKQISQLRMKVSTPQFSDEDEFEPDKSSVLIIDDNPDILYFLKENFEKQYHVLQALNGKLGLELAFTACAGYYN